MPIRTSRVRSLLVALLAAGGVRALALCELPTPLFVVTAFALVVVAAHTLRSPRVTTLALHGDGCWHALLSNGERIVGRLAEAGYRSAALVVLVLEEDDTESRVRQWQPRRRRHRVAVFADGVDAGDFSFLHLQLAFVGSAR